MKKIGIIFAMRKELDELLKYIHLERETKIFDLTFYEGNIGKTECVLVESGVGKVNASRCTQMLIDNMNVDYIINIGIAGGITEDIKICDIVIGEKLVQHDFDVTAFNHEKGFIPNVGVYVESDKKLIKYANDYKIEGINIHNGVIASGDIFCDSEKMSKKIHDKFNALCVEMEGASIAQVCYLCKVPFLVIRSISDSPYEGNNKITYDEFCIESSKVVAKYLNNIILNIEE